MNASEKKRLGPLLKKVIQELQQLKLEVAQSYFPNGREIIEQIEKVEVYITSDMISYLYIIDDAIELLEKCCRAELVLKNIVQYLPLLTMVCRANSTSPTYFLSLLDDSQLELFARMYNDLLDTEFVTISFRERKRFIKVLFSNDSSDFFEYHPAFEDSVISQEDRKAFLNHPFFDFVAWHIFNHPQLFPYEVIVLMNEVQEVDLTKVLEEFEPQATVQARFVPNEVGWWLCGMSEGLLISAVSENGTLIIRSFEGVPLVILKFKGKFCGVTLNPFKTADGQLIPKGIWIAPISRDTKRKLRRTFDNGYSETNQNMLSGEWAILRGVDPSNDEKFIDKAEVSSENIFLDYPDQLGVKRKKRNAEEVRLAKETVKMRKAYRENHKDEI